MSAPIRTLLLLLPIALLAACGDDDGTDLATSSERSETSAERTSSKLPTEATPPETLVVPTETPIGSSTSSSTSSPPSSSSSSTSPSSSSSTLSSSSSTSPSSSSSTFVDPLLDEVLPEGACRTFIDRDAEARTTQLCSLGGAEVQHVRIDRFKSGAGFSSIQFFLGWDDAPAGAQAPVGPGQFKIMAYGSTPNLLYGYFGEVEDSSMGAGSVAFGEVVGSDFGPEDETTICFDIHRGGENEAPLLVLWVDGVHGADCRDFSTLNFASAFGIEDEWDGRDGAIDRVDTAWFYQHVDSPARPVVTLFDRGAISCEFHPERVNTWQTLCAPAAEARFFRIDNLETTGNNSYWFLDVAQQDAEDFGSTSEESGNFVAVGGQANDGASVTWFKFDGINEGGGPGAQVERFTFALDSGAGLYVDGPTQVCLAVANDSEERAVSRFWATGAKDADCRDIATLTAESALRTDLWDAPLQQGADLLSGFRASNVNFGPSRVLVFSDGPEIVEEGE